MLDGTVKLSVGGVTNVTVVLPGHDRPYGAASNSHPRFDQIITAIESYDDDQEISEEDAQKLADLFDLKVALAKRFERLSERVTLYGGAFHLDGVPVDNRLTQQVIEFYEAGVEDYAPLVAYFENVQNNPDENSREELFGFVQKYGIQINENGMLVLYKGVAADPYERGTTWGNAPEKPLGWEPEEGVWYSQNAGHAIVNDEWVDGYIPNRVGDTIEMPRNEVVNAPSIACHVGLHVARFQFAKNFGRTAVLQVLVNPRDVVSVPYSSDKLRVCRYFVQGVAETPDEGVLVRTAPVGAPLSDDEAHGVVLLDLPDDAFTPPPGHPDDLREDDEEDDIEPEYCSVCGETEAYCVSMDSCEVDDDDYDDEEDDELDLLEEEPSATFAAIRSRKSGREFPIVRIVDDSVVFRNEKGEQITKPIKGITKSYIKVNW